MKPTRLSWIDYARGIAIILVVYRHVFEGLKESGIPVGKYIFLEYANIFLFSFRMPLFFIVSGIFLQASFKKRGFLQYVDTKARMILYPYFVWGFLYLTLQMVFTNYTNGHPTPSSYLNLFYLPREVGPFWYLYALFNISVLYSFVRYVLKVPAIFNVLIGLICFYLSSFVYQENIKIGLLFDILHNYIFFAIGDLVSKYFFDKKNFVYFESKKLLITMLIPFLLAQGYFLYNNLSHNTAKYMYVEFYEPAIFLIIVIIGCSFIMNLAFFLQKRNSFTWLSFLGKHSLYIYVAHVIAFAGVRILLTNLLGVDNLLILLITGILAGIIFPLVFYKLVIKMNVPWIFTLEKGNKMVQKEASESNPNPNKF